MRNLVGRMLIVALAASATMASAQFATKTRDYEFDYSYPAAAARIAPLKAWFDADAAKMRAELVHDAAAGRAESRKSGFPFNAYSGAKSWKVVTETPRFLSLSGEVSGYSGGAHGNAATLSLVWDKKTGGRIDGAAAFAPAALQSVLGARWCEWVRGERSKRIGSDAGSDGFFKCPAIKELTVLLGSTNGRAINRVGLIADQYVAGSYAEGQYETTFPVTAPLLAAVKPLYRDAFEVR